MPCNLGLLIRPNWPGSKTRSAINVVCFIETLPTSLSVHSTDILVWCRLLSKLDFPKDDMRFTVYFLGYESLEEVPENAQDRVP